MSNKKRMLAGTNEIVTVVVAIISVIVLNVIMARYPVPFDMTENQIYTLSDASKEAVQGLEEPVQVKVYISPDMPAPYHGLGQTLGDLLSDYEAASKGKLTFQIVSPAADDEEAEKAARGFGIEKVAIGSRSEDEVSMRAVYKAAAFVMGDKTEVIGNLHTSGDPEFDNFEYDFTKALLNLRNTEPRRLAFVGGFGGPSSNPKFVEGVKPVFENLYGKLIEVTSVDLSTADAKVPENVDALVILNASKPFNERAKFEIDQFLQRGGSVGWYQSSSSLDQQVARQLIQQLGPDARMPDIRAPLEPNLRELFAHYGIDHQQDLVIDRKNALSFGVVETSQGLAQVSHPATFLMSDVNRAVPFTRDLGAVAMPGPASLAINPDIEKNTELEFMPLITTAEVAVRRPESPKTFGYETLKDKTSGERPGPFVVAAALKGKMPSYYAGNPLPEGITEEQLAKDSSDEARVLVVGSGEFFVSNPQIGFSDQLSAMGARFLISSMEWLVQDTKLAGIRGKSNPRLVGEIPREEQRRIKYFNIAFVPAFFAVLGWTILQFRRRRKKNLTLD